MAHLKPFVLDPGLRPYATDRQWADLELISEHGSVPAAAKATGKDRGNFHRTISIVTRRAAQKGYAPEYDLTHPAAPGMSVKGTSIRYNADGGIEQYWNKTRQEGRSPEEVVRLPDPKTIVKLSTLYDQEGNVTQQWVAEKPDAVAQAHAWEEYARALAEPLPRYEPSPMPEGLHRGLTACYPVGDHHMGMLSWGVETNGDWDLDIAEGALVRATDYFLDTQPACDRALIAFLGDFMHYDSFEPVTPTNRNMLDVDSRYPKMVRASVRAMRHMIERAAERHGEVHVIVEIGNHDLSSSIFLMECLRNVYENEPRIVIDASPKHYHYYEFGKVLIGTHHGHGAKMQDLPLIMAHDQPEAWGRTRHRYFWTGHLHNKTVQVQDFAGCRVERFCVLGPADAYAHQKGYRAFREMNSILIHEDHGEVARGIVNPGMFLDTKE